MSQRHALRAVGPFLACLVLVSSIVGQMTPPAPGFRLFGPLAGTDTYLVDVGGNIVHTWPSSYTAGAGVYLLEDGSLLRAVHSGFVPGVGGGVGGGVQRVAFNGTLLWDFRYDGPGYMSHHDIEPMPNGNVLLIAWEDKTAAEAVAAGRNPAFMTGSIFRPDHIVEVQPTGPTSGTIVWEWHVWDHLIQDYSSSQANYGAVANHRELVDINYPLTAAGTGDWNHTNSIDYDPIYDRILLCAPRQGEIWVIDHSTTTAEAAGHTGGMWGRGGDLLYRWGNPQAYRAGTSADRKLFGHHAAVFIPPGFPGAGNILLFNNNLPGGSAVWELVPPLDPAGAFIFGPGGTYGPPGPVWSHSGNFNSNVMSNAERLANGNTLICSGAQGRIFEVTSGGQEVWSYTFGGGGGAGIAIFHAHYVEHYLWSDATAVSAAAGGSVAYDLVAGSGQAGLIYALLASASGTSPGLWLNGIVLPLNLDPFLIFTIEAANSPLFNQTMGLLDPLGKASASVNLPAGLPPFLVGLPLHLAYGVMDPFTLLVTMASNPVPLQITP